MFTSAQNQNDVAMECMHCVPFGCFLDDFRSGWTEFNRLATVNTMLL